MGYTDSMANLNAYEADVFTVIDQEIEAMKMEVEKTRATKTRGRGK